MLAIPCVCAQEGGGSQALCCPSIRYRWGVPEKGGFPRYGGSGTKFFPLEESPDVSHAHNLAPTQVR